MLSSIFSGLFGGGDKVIAVTDFLLCVGTSLLIGAFLAAVYAFRTRYTKSFLITLGILPATVCIIIMMVNGNLGAGVAVAGAFALVRFRSMPGTAAEIAVLLLAMAAGLITGMGYLMYAALFTVIMGAILFVCRLIPPIKIKGKRAVRVMRITVPEDLDYSGLFDDILDEYTSYHKIVSVKTVGLGSLFKLTFELTEKDVNKEKEMIDRLRERNGNLEIAISEEAKRDEL